MCVRYEGTDRAERTFQRWRKEGNGSVCVRVLHGDVEKNTKVKRDSQEFHSVYARVYKETDRTHML